MLLTESELYFLHLILHNESDIQNKFILKKITSKQYKLLKQIACFILDETITLSTYEFTSLKQFKNIIRKLGTGKRISGNILSKYLKLIKVLAEITINKYEICTKGSSNTCRRMGKNKKQNIKRSGENRNSSKRSIRKREYSPETSTSESEGESTDESDEYESEEERNVKPRKSEEKHENEQSTTENEQSTTENEEKTEDESEESEVTFNVNTDSE